MRSRALTALISFALLAGSDTSALAAPIAPPVECWIENQTPSIPAGGWANYVVHASGGYGSYSVTLSYGDGSQEQKSGSYWRSLS